MSDDCVILAAGDFPCRGGRAWQLLATAKRVVACDSAAVSFRRRFRRWPDVIVGDLDSVPRTILRRTDVTVVRVAEQETNDLTKAIDFCRQQGWRRLSIVGACGKREDHALGNVFRALEAQVTVVTDHGVFRPVCGAAAFRMRMGTAVSIFAPDPSTRMTSKGLEWPLDGILFPNLYCATLNRAKASRVSVTSSHPVFIYIAEI